jgi:hypothetical protein
MSDLAAISDDDLWAEVQRRELATVIGYVRPDSVSADDEGRERYLLFERTWLHRWPVYGLRGGDSIKSCVEADHA